MSALSSTVGFLSIYDQSATRGPSNTRITIQFNRPTALTQSGGLNDPLEYKVQYEINGDEMKERNGLYLGTLLCLNNDLERAPTHRILDVNITFHDLTLPTPPAHLSHKVNEFGKTVFFEALRVTPSVKTNDTNNQVEESDVEESDEEEETQQVVLITRDKLNGRIIGSSDCTLAPISPNNGSYNPCTFL